VSLTPEILGRRTHNLSRSGLFAVKCLLGLLESEGPKVELAPLEARRGCRGVARNLLGVQTEEDLPVGDGRGNLRLRQYLLAREAGEVTLHIIHVMPGTGQTRDPGSNPWTNCCRWLKIKRCSHGSIEREEGCRISSPESGSYCALKGQL
jgi:hypothetical protein